MERIYRNQPENIAPQYMSKNKTKPGLSLEVFDENQNAIDFSNANITLIWKRFDPDNDAMTTLSVVNTPTGDENGILQYEFDAIDTQTAGIYFAQFDIEYSDSTTEVFPPTQGIQVNIL